MTANPVLCRWKNQTCRNKVCLQTWLWCTFILTVLCFLVCVYSMCFYYFIWLCVSFLFPSLKAFCTLTSPAGIEYITLYVVTFNSSSSSHPRSTPLRLSLSSLIILLSLHIFSFSTSFFAPWFSSFSPHHYVLYLSLWVLLIYRLCLISSLMPSSSLLLPTLYPLSLSQHGSHPFFSIVINIECVFWSVWVEGDRQVELSQSVQSVEAVFTL